VQEKSGDGFWVIIIIIIFLCLLFGGGGKKDEPPEPVPQYTPIQREPIINAIPPQQP
jgi:hypothetical protein